MTSGVRQRAGAQLAVLAGAWAGVFMAWRPGMPPGHDEAGVDLGGDVRSRALMQ